MRYLATISFFFLFQCLQAQKVDIQGHRGARGLMPENTIPAFLRAIDEGVTTLELDVVITMDNKVVVSHEPYMSNGICTKPNGSAVTAAESKGLNIYQMTYEEVTQYDCGIRGNKRFPEQEKLGVFKPLLRDMISTVERYLKENNLPELSYNIEVKSSEKGDNVYHPGVEKFSSLVYDLITSQLSIDRFTIQSFDFRVLKHWNKAYPNIELVALIENRNGVESNLSALGFVPDVYSPNYLLLNKKVVNQCHEKGMKVVPWTVNDLKAMKGLAEMGVDGIITDYPNRAKGL